MQLLEEQFEQMYVDNYKYVYGFCRSRIGGLDDSMVEDIVQETFVKAFKNLHQYEGDLRLIRTWLCSIAKNTYKDYFRRRKNKPQISLDKILDAVDKNGARDSHQADRLLKKVWEENQSVLNSNKREQEKISNIMHVATQNLNQQQLKVFKLAHIDGLGLKIIAEQLNLSHGNVRQINSRSIAKIKEVM